MLWSHNNLLESHVQLTAFAVFACIYRCLPDSTWLRCRVVSLKGSCSARAGNAIAGFPASRQNFGLSFKLQVAVQKRGQLRLGQCADLLRGNCAVLEQDERGNAAHSKLHRCRLMLVHIDLRDLEAVAVILGHFVEDRSNHLARAAPFRPEVEQDGFIRFRDILVKGCVADMFDRFAHYVNTSMNSRPAFECSPRYTKTGNSSPRCGV